MTDKPELIAMTYDDIKPGFGDVDLIAVEIGAKGEMTPARAIDAVQALNDARRFYPKAKLLILVGGYDQDKRELWDIPEARRYISLVMAEASDHDPGLLDALEESSYAVVGVCIGVLRVAGRDPVTGNWNCVPVGMPASETRSDV